MPPQKESFEFDLDTFYRLETTKRPSASIAVYAEMLATMVIQNSTRIECEVRFLCESLKMGTHTVTETLNEFRKMGLVRFIPIKERGHKRFSEMINEGG
jgi:Mn-dependent DtxR family transcriptional regulator